MRLFAVCVNGSSYIRRVGVLERSVIILASAFSMGLRGAAQLPSSA